MRRQRNAQELKTGCLDGESTVVAYRDSDVSVQAQAVAMTAMVDAKTMALVRSEELFSGETSVAANTLAEALPGSDRVCADATEPWSSWTSGRSDSNGPKKTVRITVPAVADLMALTTREKRQFAARRKCSANRRPNLNNKPARKASHVNRQFLPL